MDIKEVSKEIEFLFTDFSGDIHTLDLCIKNVEGDAIEFARAFVVLRQLKDKIDEAIKPFDKLFEDVKTVRLPAVFDLAGVPTVNLDEGYRVTVAYNTRASIKGGQKDAAFQWLRDNGLGDIVSETVNSSTLSAVAKSMVEENRELNPDLFNVHVLPTTSVTKKG